MNTTFDALHPRATTGKFTDKEQSAPQLDLTRRTFAPGDELPRLSPGTAVEVDGERYYRVVDHAYGSQWLSPTGEPVVLEDVSFRVVPESEVETDNFDGTFDRPVATLTTDDTIIDETENLSGRVQRLVRKPGDPVIYVHLTNGGTRRAEPGAVVTTRRTPPHTYANATAYWDQVEAASAGHTDTETLALILDEQSEDDFMVAVIANPNVTAELIERASQHHSLAVRRDAVFAPAASVETLERIRAEALVSSDEALQTRVNLGVSPDSAHWVTMHGQYLSLAVAADQELTRKARASGAFA
jgi:hypothetical protein